MGEIRWYKRDPDAALAGMAMLTLEECGAYNLILDAIYSREGNLRDDEREITQLLRCSARVWRRIRKRLFDLGKLYVHGGNLHNPRSDKEIHAAKRRLSGSAHRELLPNYGQVGRPTTPKLKKNPNENNGKIRHTYNQNRKKESLRLSLGRESKEKANRGSEEALKPSPELRALIEKGKRPK